MRMTKDLATNKWFVSLIDDIHSAIVEGEFNARWTIVETYHAVGKRILEEEDNFNKAKIKDIFAQVRNYLEQAGINKSDSTLYRCVQFARQYPDLAMLKEGKNVSWHAVCQKYLPLPKDMQTEKEKSTYDTILKQQIKFIESLPDKFSLDLAREFAKELVEKLNYWIGEWREKK